MNNATQGEGKPQRMSTGTSLLIEVQIRQPQHDCLLYAWDHKHACLQVTGIHQAEAGLPADLGVVLLEGWVEVPTFLPMPHSSPPGTLVSARLVGALQNLSADGTKDDSFPLDGWILVAVAEITVSLAECTSLDQLPPVLLAQLKAYVQAQAANHQNEAGAYEIAACDAEAAARFLRESRLWLKREQRRQPRRKDKFSREEERPVAWRAIEGLSQALRAELLKETATGNIAPHARAEHLIRFVPQRFQKALSDLLLDDEQLLAFIERPLLLHRTGLFGMQTWRSNEGLFLLTDRQILWLRDFLSPGANFLEGGYIAHSAPLERLRNIMLLPAGSAPQELTSRLASQDLPYLRLVMEVESKAGAELFVVEFPGQAEAEKALAQIISLLRAFLPSPEGTMDRRVRRLPIVEMWQPQGAEAEQLAHLGGFVPAEVSQRLKQHLTDVLSRQEEVLVSVLVPALEDYHSPARLIALTRQAILLLEERSGKQVRAIHAQEGSIRQEQRYELATISSAQLRYSLLGSGLSLFVPQPHGQAHQLVIPFHSPAIAWFLPLFTRLRVALGGPYREQ